MRTWLAPRRFRVRRDAQCPISRVPGTGFPNQVNNCLAFSGIFRGALEVGATCINEAMKVAADHAIAGALDDADLRPERIIPDAMDFSVSPRVAEAVAQAAVKRRVAPYPAEPGEVGRRLTDYIYEEKLESEWAGDQEGLACLLPELGAG